VNRHSSLIALAIAAVFALGTCARVEGALTVSPGKVQDPAAPGNAERDLFTQGQNLVLQGSYTSAAEVLEKFLATYPDSILTDLTLLWLGRSYFQLGRLTEAEELGKRLHAIKDTPFAEIYDVELKSAIREAAKQPIAGEPRKLSPVVRPLAKAPATSKETPKSGRDRYATVRSSAPNASAANKNKKTANSTQRSVAGRRSSGKGGAPKVAGNAGVKTARPAVRQPTKTASVNANRPRSASKSPAVALHRSLAAANKPRRIPLKANAPAGKTATATLKQTSTKTGKIAGKEKPTARTPGRDRALSRKPQASAATIAKRTTRLVNSARTARNRPNVSNSTPRATGDVADMQRSAYLAPPVPRGSDDPRPQTINGHAVTGGLYSMVDASMAPAPVLAAAPASVPPDSRVDARSKGMNAKPGETVYLSFVVRNYGSTRQTYELRITAPGSPEAQLYVDSNGDGMHQSDELRVTGSPVIELKNSEVPFLLEVKVPRNAAEGQQFNYTVTVLSFGSGEVVAKVTSTLTVSSIRAALRPSDLPEQSRSIRTK
jgi:hypothetical protein